MNVPLMFGDMVLTCIYAKTLARSMYVLYTYLRPRLHQDVFISKHYLTSVFKLAVYN